MSNLSIHFTRVEVEDIAPSTDTEICARVYASVSPIEPGHSCGMVYSIDNWTTSKEVVGKFTHNDIEHEVWEFDAVVKGEHCLEVNFNNAIQFALWVSKDGQKVWDNNAGKNHAANLRCPKGLCVYVYREDDMLQMRR